jgi:hypothetical protein
MPVPAPLPDPSHIETRLLVVAAMLDKAVAEVNRTLAEIKGELTGTAPAAADTPCDVRSPDEQ